jgi:exodeoxyribonuclease VII large subunit
MQHYLNIIKEREGSLIEKLEALSPLAVLSRGYSLSMLLPAGIIIKDALNLKLGDKVKTVLAKGSFIGSVEEVIKDKSKGES